jgi:membrane protease YdiL (CAAX protease family)
LVAPITEEMFFRVFLQGWMEKVERKLRRRIPFIRSIMPLATIPILFSSLLFASAHFREAGPTEDVRKLLWVFMGNGVVSLASLLFGVLWLRYRAGAKAEDLGWVPNKFLSDVKLGVTTFAAIAVPIFCINMGLVKLLPEKYAPDPISIFFFAIVLGLLYNRTHRAAPSIAVHMALNATSLTLLLLMGWAK